MKNIIIIISCFIFISCNSQSDKATLYNNTLLVEQQKIGSEIKSYLDVVKDTSESWRLVDLKKKILAEIKNSIEKVQKLSDFNGNNVFKESVISVLTAYSEGVEYEYSAIAAYQMLPHSEKTEQKKWEAEEHAIHADEKITKAEDYFILMQQEFAKENNFDLD